MHAFYRQTMGQLCANDKGLRPNFKRNVFGAATFNLGPRLCTEVHTDHLNFAPGWSGIIALGDYDPKLGGHLVLWDLKILVEFPPGSLIFIPSAILRHSHTAVGDHERQMSFTQFTAGGLFRWVECGFCSQKDFLASGREHVRTGAERWAEAIEMYSTWDELQRRSARRH